MKDESAIKTKAYFVMLDIKSDLHLYWSNSKGHWACDKDGMPIHFCSVYAVKYSLHGFLFRYSEGDMDCAHCLERLASNIFYSIPNYRRMGNIPNVTDHYLEEFVDYMIQDLKLEVGL